MAMLTMCTTTASLPAPLPPIRDLASWRQVPRQFQNPPGPAPGANRNPTNNHERTSEIRSASEGENTSVYVGVSPQSFSRVQLFATPWTVARQVPLSMEFSRQDYWRGLPFPSPGDLPNPGIKPMSPALGSRFLNHCTTYYAPYLQFNPYPIHTTGVRKSNLKQI